MFNLSQSIQIFKYLSYQAPSRMGLKDSKLTSFSLFNESSYIQLIVMNNSAIRRNFSNGFLTVGILPLLFVFLLLLSMCLLNSLSYSSQLSLLLSISQNLHSSELLLLQCPHLVLVLLKLVLLLLCSDLLCSL